VVEVLQLGRRTRILSAEIPAEVEHQFQSERTGLHRLDPYWGEATSELFDYNVVISLLLL
jgi:hypothetical protein